MLERHICFFPSLTAVLAADTFATFFLHPDPCKALHTI